MDIYIAFTLSIINKATMNMNMETSQEFTLNSFEYIANSEIFEWYGNSFFKIFWKITILFSLESTAFYILNSTPGFHFLHILINAYHFLLLS